MAVTVTGVPEKISRADYMHLIESVGFELSDLRELNFGTRSITATVLAHDSEGNAFLEPLTNDVAVHHITIPVED